MTKAILQTTFKLANQKTVKNKIWKILGITSLVSLLSTIILLNDILEFLIKKFNVTIGLKTSILILTIVLSIIFAFRYIIIFFSTLEELIGKKISEEIDSKLSSKTYIQDIEFILTSVSQLKTCIKQKKSDQETATSIMELCTKIKNFFDKKTNFHCCVTIKISDKNDTSVTKWNRCFTNLCRDQEHQHKRGSEAYLRKKHSVEENTAFEEIVKALSNKNYNNAYYVNNNIPLDENYKNSSRNTYVNNILPYQSEIVCPIFPVYKDDLSQLLFAGFICLDCEKPFDFDKEDVIYIKIVADCLYDILQETYALDIKY